MRRTGDERRAQMTEPRFSISIRARPAWSRRRRDRFVFGELVPQEYGGHACRSSHTLGSRGPEHGPRAHEYAITKAGCLQNLRRRARRNRTPIPARRDVRKAPTRAEDIDFHRRFLGAGISMDTRRAPTSFHQMRQDGPITGASTTATGAHAACDAVPKPPRATRQLNAIRCADLRREPPSENGCGRQQGVAPGSRCLRPRS